MANRKASTKGKGHWLGIHESIYKSRAWMELSDSAIRLWLDLRTQYWGSNNGAIVATMSKLRKRGWNSNAKLNRALDQLLDHGLLVRTRKAKRNFNHMASLYAFTDVAIDQNDEHGVDRGPPSNAYLYWSPEKKTEHLQKVSNDTRKGLESGPPAGRSMPQTAPLQGIPIFSQIQS